jgi:hypothetical protein
MVCRPTLLMLIQSEQSMTLQRKSDLWDGWVALIGHRCYSYARTPLRCRAIIQIKASYVVAAARGMVFASSHEMFVGSLQEMR